MDTCVPASSWAEVIPFTASIKEALINLQKLLKAIKEHQTEGILQRFLKF